jgi:hypothetical protein
MLSNNNNWFKYDKQDQQGKAAFNERKTLLILIIQSSRKRTDCEKKVQKVPYEQIAK